MIRNVHLDSRKWFSGEISRDSANIQIRCPQEKGPPFSGRRRPRIRVKLCRIPWNSRICCPRRRVPPSLGQRIVVFGGNSAQFLQIPKSAVRIKGGTLWGWEVIQFLWNPIGIPLEFHRESIGFHRIRWGGQICPPQRILWKCSTMQHCAALCSTVLQHRIP